MGTKDGIRFCDACGQTLGEGERLVLIGGSWVCPQCVAPTVPVVSPAPHLQADVRVLWCGKPSFANYFGVLFLAVIVGLIGLVCAFLNLCFGLFLFVIAGVMVLWVILERANTYYTLTNRKVSAKSGIIGKRSSEVDLADIRNIVVHFGINERLLGIGKVLIASSSANTFEIRFIGVKNPDNVKMMIVRAKDGIGVEAE